MVRAAVGEVLAGGGFKTLDFVVPAFVSSGDADDPWNAGVTGLVENHFQFDHFGGLGSGLRMGIEQCISLIF